jgi:hypothetical protein
MDSGIGANMEIGGVEEETEEGVRSAKKKELREHQKII